MSLNQKDDIVKFKLERLFECFPWELGNYLQIRQGRHEADTYFALPYINLEHKRQLILVYNIPFIIRHDAPTYAQKYSPHKYSLTLGEVPLLRAFGAHRVHDVS